MRYFITSGYLGKRLFSWNQYTGDVISVVVVPPPKKKGRPYMRGIYRVSESTIRGNYLWHLKDKRRTCVKETTEKLFNYYRNQLIEEIKSGKL